MPSEQDMYQSSSRSHKRAAVSPPEDALASLPSNDSNSWYYPANFEEGSDEDVLPLGTTRGNWGRKRFRSSRWIRKGKNAPWGPGKYEWEWEERVRKRLKAALPQHPRSPSPPVLPHLRSPSPPLMAPYPQLTFEHSNYSSLIMDPSVQHSFRSRMLNDISRAINNLIEGEAAMKRAVGRLWQAAYSMQPETEPGPSSSASTNAQAYPHAIKGDTFGVNNPLTRQENGDLGAAIIEDGDELALDGHTSKDALQSDEMVSDEVPKPQKLPPFLSSGNMSTINDLVGDSSEYVSRLEEVREGLGFTIGQRNALWTTIREKALAEMQQQEEEEEDS